MYPVWLRRSSLILLALIFGLPLIAWAQEAAAQPVPTSAATTLGAVLQLAQIAVVSALSLALASFGAYLVARTKGASYETAVKKIWNLFAVNASHAYAELRPMVQAALADGKIDATEWAALKAKLVELVRGQTGPFLDGILKAIGILPAGVEAFLTSMADRALRALLDKQGVKAPTIDAPPEPPALDDVPQPAPTV